jgi:hypothetical protein
MLLLSLLAVYGCASAASSSDVVQEDRVIAGSPKDSVEVRHLVLRGTNEQIGRALAEIGKERYGVRLEPARDPVQVRAERKYLERNYPILLDRMRGVAAAFGKSVDDDAWDFAGLGFTDLKAGCSIVHAPPSMTTNGKSVVSRDYDFTTGALSFGFLPPGMLHPTARPYLPRAAPRQGVRVDRDGRVRPPERRARRHQLRGAHGDARDGQPDLQRRTTEPTRARPSGLGELQTLRLLLDTCATVEEAKQTLMATKQYYQYVPVHYLIADRNGNAFVWEYSEQHNMEHVIENPGKLLVMTNFTIHKQLEDGKPPSAEKARATCKRYAYLNEKLAKGGLDDETIRTFHKACDAQASQAVNPSQPPERTFWHAFYYPEDRACA